MQLKMFKNSLNNTLLPGLGLFAILSLASCGNRAALSNSLSSILFVPGYGMEALNVAVSGVQGEVANFDVLLPSMNPNSIFMPPLESAQDFALKSGLRIKDLNRVSEWLKPDIADDGERRRVNQELRSLRFQSVRTLPGNALVLHQHSENSSWSASFLTRGVGARAKQCANRIAQPNLSKSHFRE